MFNLNIIIMFILLIVFILIFLSNSHETFTTTTQSPSDRIVSMQSTIESLEDRHASLQASIEQHQGAEHQQIIDSEECTQKISKIAGAIGVDLSHDENDIINSLQDQNGKVIANLGKIYLTLQKLQTHMAKENSIQSNLVGDIETNINLGSQHNRHNLINFLKNLDTEMNKLQDQSMSVMQSVLINSINKIAYDLMESNKNINTRCSQIPEHKCNNYNSCTLNNHGYGIKICGINPNLFL